GARDEARGAAHPVGRHLLGGFAQVRVPVAVAPVDRQVDAVGVEVLAHRGHEGAVLVVDGRLPAELEVVLTDLDETLGRDPPAARHVLKERHDVVGLFGTAEGHEENGIDGCRHIRYLSPVLKAYRRVLSTPGAAAFSAAGAVGRLPLSMAGLGIVLLMSERLDSYGKAGIVAAGYILVAAACAP